MANYLGVNCPVCDKRFTADDDIVVCPICGAPHHRDCYAKLNQCAFEEEHVSGKAWTPPKTNLTDEKIADPKSKNDLGTAPSIESEAELGETRACLSCGAKNAKDNIFCDSCGNKLIDAQVFQGSYSFGGVSPVDTQRIMYGNVSPDEKIGEHCARDVASFVGGNSAYYLTRFKAIENNNKSFTFTLSAFFFTFSYYFYRKMYKLGALFLALYLVLSVPSLLYTKEAFPILLKEQFTSQQLENLGIDAEKMTSNLNREKIAKYETAANVAFYLRTAVMMVSGVFAVRAYYKHTIKKMDEIVEDKKQCSVRDLSKEQTLRASGGVNTKVVVILMVAMLVATFILSSFIAKDVLKESFYGQVAVSTAAAEENIPEFQVKLGENVEINTKYFRHVLN